MSRCSEGKQRLVEFGCFYLSLFVPFSIVWQDGVGEMVGSHVHIGLVLVTST